MRDGLKKVWKKLDKGRSNSNCVIVGILMLVIAGSLQVAARNVPGFGEWYTVTVYRRIVGVYARCYSVFPFSVVEITLYIIIIGTIWWIASHIAAAWRRWRENGGQEGRGRKARGRKAGSGWQARGRKAGSVQQVESRRAGSAQQVGKMPHTEQGYTAEDKEQGKSKEPPEGTIAACAARIFLFMSLLAFLYTVCCGVNYYRQPFSSYLDLEIRKSPVDELRELCEYLTDMVNETVETGDYDISWTKKGRQAMMALGEQYEQLNGYYPRPKALMISWILSVQQLSGIYSPFTLEGNFNREMTAYNIPHTMCHELSHLRGFMREDEANFIGYLACIGSDDRMFQYSGYLTGWVYAGNALAAQDPESYRDIYGRLNEQSIADLRDNNAFWNRYEGKVAEVANQVNDTYLKINDQSDGVKSYGRMVDLMLAYYRQ